MARPTKRTCLACLTKARLLELDRAFELGTPQAEPKHAFLEALAQSKSASFGKLLEQLTQAELKHLCRSHELATSGTKAQLQGRLLGTDIGGAPERDQASLFEEVEDEDRGGIDAQVAAFLLRAQPSVAGIVPRLTPLEVSSLLRRLSEQHGVTVDLSRFEPSPENLGRALAEATSLAVVLGELSREQLDRISQHYGLSPVKATREGYVRALLAAAAGITEDEALAIEEDTPQPLPHAGARGEFTARLGSVIAPEDAAEISEDVVSSRREVTDDDDSASGTPPRAPKGVAAAASGEEADATGSFAPGALRHRDASATQSIVVLPSTLHSFSSRRVDSSQRT